MYQLNMILQTITLFVLIAVGGYLIVDSESKEDQALIWLKDAEDERKKFAEEAAIERAKINERVRRLETNEVFNRDNYKQFE